MKVGILYICTGKYSIFWKDFFKQAEKLLLPNCTKEYFVFTDAAHIYSENSSRVHKIFQKQLGWPFDTLKRFEMFLQVEDQLKSFDYLFFFNANMRLVDTVDESILPSEQEGLVAVLQPWLYNSSANEFTLETNPLSTAYVEPSTATHYYMGSLNGGITKNYIELIKQCNQNIYADLEKNIIAIWHDESHLNKYLLGKQIKVLGPEYAYPEDSGLPFKPKMMLLEKGKLGGHSWLRSTEKNTVKDGIGYLKLFIKKLLGRW